MANLYDKAGLVNIPVGYQEGFLYNIKPTDNTLAFRFNRDSAATRVNKEGLIEQVGYFGPELVQNGDFATDSDWSYGSSWSIANGKATATNSTTGSIYQDVLDTSKIYKATFEITEITSGGLRIGIGVNFSDYFTETGIYTYYGQPTTDGLLRINPSSGTNASIDNVSVTEVLGDKPRIDYTDSLTSPSFLLEPQSTNVLENSEITSTWTYTEFGSGSSGTITTGKTDMFGSTNAVQIDFPADAENVTLAFGQTTSSISSGSASSSVYIKLVESGSKTLQLRCSPSLTTLINVDETKFVRYELSGTKSASEAFTLKLRPSEGTSSGGFSIIVCQPQEEALSYPTSYIPTAGSAATRVQETCNGAGSSSTFNDSEGVLYAEIQGLNDTDATSRYISLTDGTTTNALFIQYRNSGELRLYNGGISTAQIIYRDASADLTENIKLAIKYGTSTSDYKVYINGSSVTVAGAFVATSMSGLDELKFEYVSGAGNFYGKVKGIYVFNEALTDDELQQLTT